MQRAKIHQIFFLLFEPRDTLTGWQLWDINTHFDCDLIKKPFHFAFYFSSLIFLICTLPKAWCSVSGRNKLNPQGRSNTVPWEKLPSSACQEKRTELLEWLTDVPSNTTVIWYSAVPMYRGTLHTLKRLLYKLGWEKLSLFHFLVPEHAKYLVYCEHLKPRECL